MGSPLQAAASMGAQSQTGETKSRSDAPVQVVRRSGRSPCAKALVPVEAANGTAPFNHLSRKVCHDRSGEEGDICHEEVGLECSSEEPAFSTTRSVKVQHVLGIAAAEEPLRLDSILD
eukprot:CAMPEP_0183371034 /NCGR_PEP_ID=MMETSP0164_2-20130417/104213_1 /TAXON_ID=221442 /ORGANISM="Coccolithus pelagicus ssp braarudi, Strain PLY182g" /LENGTH=117 /DNA_ID=CAMNT_0025547533 /DNA_START=222 /DNA_END=576 /DNA_ORIENTATION=-